MKEKRANERIPNPVWGKSFFNRLTVVGQWFEQVLWDLSFEGAFRVNSFERVSHRFKHTLWGNLKTCTMSELQKSVTGWSFEDSIHIVFIFETITLSRFNTTVVRMARARTLHISNNYGLMQWSPFSSAFLPATIRIKIKFSMLMQYVEVKNSTILITALHLEYVQYWDCALCILMS